MRSQQTNEELVAEYQRTREPGVLEDICERNIGLVFSTVKDFRGIYSNESKNRAAIIGSDDLEQSGYIGLIEAVKNYDPDRGATFATAAIYYIKAAICRELYNAGYSIRLPPYVFLRLKRLKIFRERFFTEYGRKPTEGEMRDFLGMSNETLKELLGIEIRTNLESLNAPVGDDSESLTLAEVLPDGTNQYEEVEEGIQNEQLKRDLWRFVDELKPEYSDVLHRFYENGESLDQIGNSLEQPGKRIKAMKENALNALRSGKCRRVLAFYSESCGRAESVAYSGSLNCFMRTGESSTERAAFMRMGATEKAIHNVHRRAVFAEHGFNYEERKNYYEYLKVEEQRNKKKRLEGLKNERSS